MEPALQLYLVLAALSFVFLAPEFCHTVYLWGPFFWSVDVLLLPLPSTSSVMNEAQLSFIFLVLFLYNFFFLKIELSTLRRLRYFRHLFLISSPKTQNIPSSSLARPRSMPRPTLARSFRTLRSKSRHRAYFSFCAKSRSWDSLLFSPTLLATQPAIRYGPHQNHTHSLYLYGSVAKCKMEENPRAPGR